MRFLRYSTLEAQTLLHPVAGYIAVPSIYIKLKKTAPLVFNLQDTAMILVTTNKPSESRHGIASGVHTFDQMKQYLESLHKNIRLTKTALIIPDGVEITMSPDLIYELTGNSAMAPTEYKTTEIKLKKNTKFQLADQAVIIIREKISKKYFIPAGVYTFDELEIHFNHDLKLTKESLIIISGKKAVFSTNLIEALTGSPDLHSGEYRSGEIKLKKARKNTEYPSVAYFHCEQVDSFFLNQRDILAMIPNITQQQTIEFKPHFLEWNQLKTHHHNYTELSFRLTDEDGNDIQTEKIYFTVVINERL